MSADTSTTLTEPHLRLMHLVSPSLPVGAFTYSHGIEWAVEAGWIRTAADLEAWLRDQLRNALARVDLPILIRLCTAAREGDSEAMERWIDWLLATRETAELRLEETNRGRALVELLLAWDLLPSAESALDNPPLVVEGLGRGRCWRSILARSQAAGFAFAAVAWGIQPREAALGYAWAWLENLVLAAVKLAPLGQTQGQQALARLVAEVPALVEQALTMDDDDIGAASPALAIASSAHETQYTRLFRS